MLLTQEEYDSSVAKKLLTKSAFSGDILAACRLSADAVDDILNPQRLV